MSGFFQRIGIAREGKSPENPSERADRTDLRVALAPAEVKRLVHENGCEISVETGAGEGIGFSADDYRAAGAVVQSEQDLWANKDLVVKLKGPSLDSIEMMNRGTTVLCFAHIDTFPERRRLFEEHAINVLAMEEILHRPESISDSELLGKAATQHLLKRMEYVPGETDVCVVGFSESLVGTMRQASRMGAKVRVVRPDFQYEELRMSSSPMVLIYDSSRCPVHEKSFAQLIDRDVLAFDLGQISKSFANDAIGEYLERYPLKEFGKRRVECLHDTGRCGARFGYELLANVSPLQISPTQANVIVTGYGNVAIGAIHEAYEKGARSIEILGRAQVDSEKIRPYLAQADLIINGIDLGDQKGKQYVITREHTSNLIKSGAVVIDLVGGSKTERSAIENVLTCTFLTDPYFEEHGVYFAAVWGWPMLGMMRESALRYSSQIMDILTGPEHLISGLDNLEPSVQRALVAGPKLVRASSLAFRPAAENEGERVNFTGHQGSRFAWRNQFPYSADG